MGIKQLAALPGTNIDIHELGELLRHGAPGFALATMVVSFFLVLAWFSLRTDSSSKSPWPLYVFMVFSIVCFGFTLVLPPDPSIVVRSELGNLRNLIQEERLMQCSIIAKCITAKIASALVRKNDSCSAGGLFVQSVRSIVPLKRLLRLALIC